MPNIDYTTLTFDQLREPYLRAEGWTCEKAPYRTMDRFEYRVVDKDRFKGSYRYLTAAEAWQCPLIIKVISIDSLLGPGGAMERLAKEGRFTFAMLIEDMNFQVWQPGSGQGLIRKGEIPFDGSPSDALCRAVMIATIISHEQENTNG